MRTKAWMRAQSRATAERAVISARCERCIAEGLKPRYLPQVHPTQFNYPIDLVGRMRGNGYTFFIRYRSGYAENLGEEFDAPCARLDLRADDAPEARFDLMWHRHTGAWFRLRTGLALDEALDAVETTVLLWPV